jgi:hypothetical protein
MKIFGKEPAVWAGVLQAMIAVVLVLGVFPMTAEQNAMVQAASAAVFALLTAVFTKSVSTAVAVSAVQAVLAVLVGFGLNLTPDQTATLIGALQLALAGFLRQNTEAAVNPGLHDEPFVAIATAPQIEAEQL